LLHCEVILHLDRLRCVAGAWHAVAAAGAWRSVFSTPAYAMLWYSRFAAPDAVRVCHVTDGERSIGFLPLVETRQGRLRHLSSLTNDHAKHSVPAVLPGWEARFHDAVGTALTEFRSGWDVLAYDGIYPFTETATFDPERLRSQGLRTRTRSTLTYLVDLPKAFDDYVNGMGANARKNYKRFKNRLARAGTSRVVLYRGLEAVALWPDLVRIENAGWKGAARTSLLSLDAAYTAFYDDVLNLLVSSGDLYLYFLELDGKRIAGAMGYTEGNVFHWFKTGYDEEFRDYSPSNLLTLEIIADLIQNHPELRWFHMFPGDMDYKHRYAASYPCVKLAVYNNTLRGRCEYAMSESARLVSHVPWLDRVARAVRARLAPPSMPPAEAKAAPERV
jgi:CelD/BcsL family acetyltransferase involved in cellulose biosynthesis